MQFRTQAKTTADSRTDLPNRSTRAVRFESEVDHRNETAIDIDHKDQIHTTNVLYNKPTNAPRGCGTSPGEIRAWTLPGAVWLATGRYRPEEQRAPRADFLT